MTDKHQMIKDLTKIKQVAHKNWQVALNCSEIILAMDYRKEYYRTCGEIEELEEALDEEERERRDLSLPEEETQ